MIFWCILGCFFLFSQAYGVTASDKIDQAIVFAESGRNDIARNMLSQLLKSTLTPEEQVTALYNLAAMMARDGQYKEALNTIEKIGPALFEKGVESSPLLAFSIVYDKALYSLQVVKMKMREQNLSSNDLDGLQVLLKQGEELLAEATERIQKVVPIASDAIGPAVLTHLAEEIAQQKKALSFALFLNELQHLSKEALIDQFLFFLQNGYVEISALFDEDISDKETSLYVKAYGQRCRGQLFAYIERIILFLQVPEKNLQSEINAYLIARMELLKKSLSTALIKGNREELLAVISELMSRVRLISSRMRDVDISCLLEERIEALSMQGFEPSGTLLEQFWRKQAEERKQFLSQYLSMKANLYVKYHQRSDAALLQSFNRHIKDSVTFSDAVEDRAYWEVFSSPETDVFPKIIEKVDASGLQNKKYINFLLEAASQRLAARISVMEKPDKERAALTSINRAKKETSSQALLQDVFDAWRGLDSDSCFTFLFQRVQRGLSAKPSNLPEADLKLLVREIRLFFPHKKDREIEALLELLGSETTVVTNPKALSSRKKIAFATISVILSSFQSEVLSKEKSFAGLVREVDEAVDYQKELITFVRMARQTPDFREREAVSQAAQLFIRWQKRALPKIVQSPLLDKRPAVKALISQAEKILAPSVDSLYKTLDLLEKAAKMLHQEEKEKSQKKEPPAQKAATNEIETKTAQLTVDTAIRLLQEMERDDMSLEMPKSREKQGLRPW